MNTAGQEAIVAWHIGEGKWDGVSLDGLTIVGAIKAQATLGIPMPALSRKVSSSC